ncbi:MAG: phosphotransferase [Porticoccaceae bacterium]
MNSLCFPDDIRHLTPDMLTAVIRRLYPGVTVDSVEIVESKSYGQEMVSTAARAVLDLTYSAGADLPARVVLKLARDSSKFLAPFYENEVDFYNNLRGELSIEAPRTLGGHYDPESGQFGLLLEDLNQRDAHFPNVTEEIRLGVVESLLDELAKLHAGYWQSPRFDTDLDWVQSHRQGKVSHLQNEAVTPVIQHEIDNENFKREMVQRLRTSGPMLRAGMIAVQKHHSTLAQTLLHGDAHLGNTYILPGDKGGFLDWQLMVRGYCMHDVNYLVTTALSIEQRRNNEESLLRRYLSRLSDLGIERPPSFDEAWREYRRTLVWGVYYGWLTTPIGNYGWEINVLNHLRLTTAYEDLDTARLVAELL